MEGAGWIVQASFAFLSGTVIAGAGIYSLWCRGTMTRAEFDLVMKARDTASADQIGELRKGISSLTRRLDWIYAKLGGPPDG